MRARSATLILLLVAAGCDRTLGRCVGPLPGSTVLCSKQAATSDMFADSGAVSMADMRLVLDMSPAPDLSVEEDAGVDMTGPEDLPSPDLLAKVDATPPDAAETPDLTLLRHQPPLSYRRRDRFCLIE